MSKKQNKTPGVQPFTFFCLYSNRFIIRGRYNMACKCAQCRITSNCKTCPTKYNESEIKRREDMCDICIKKTKQIKARIAAEQEQSKKTK